MSREIDARPDRDDVREERTGRRQRTRPEDDPDFLRGMIDPVTRDREYHMPSRDAIAGIADLREAREQERARDAREAREGARHREDREVYQTQKQSYRLSDRDLRVMEEIGSFRVIDTRDLKHIYNDSRRQLVDGLDHLRRAGLIRTADRVVTDTTYAFLTAEGREVLDGRASSRLYCGTGRPREIKHDAAVYRAYLAERGRHRDDRAVRVRLDDELRADVNKDRAKYEREHGEPARGADLEQLAGRHGLPVREEAIVFPDMQIEFEREDESRYTVNVEVVTGNYTPGMVQAKIDAGFSAYVAPHDSCRGGFSLPSLTSNRGSSGGCVPLPEEQDRDLFSL
jgi:hypothetical protein